MIDTLKAIHALAFLKFDAPTYWRQTHSSAWNQYHSYILVYLLLSFCSYVIILSQINENHSFNEFQLK